MNTPGWWWALTFLILVLGACGDPLCLIQDGHLQVVIVVPANPDPCETTAAQELADYLARISGDRTQIIPSDKVSPEVPSIHVGRTGLLELPAHPSAEDIVLMQRMGPHVFLCGTTPYSTRMAVYRFLQEEGGVRWFMPGELGEHVPLRKNWEVDVLDKRASPSFLSRNLSGLATEVERTWAECNGLHVLFEMGHNLHRVFPPELFGRHPDFFPMVNGQRRPPPARGRGAWQPCFANGAVAEYAAQRAAESLKEHPERTSFSLAINDHLQLCECPECRALVSPQRFRGMPDASDLVFTFVNRAAAACTNCMFTAYAYLWCENAPSFNLLSNVAVYLTADRSFWHDPAFRKEDEDLIRRWTERCHWVGLYDYFYGTPYAIPRVFTTSMVESMKFAASVGVKGFHAELYPFWALDGPKAWLASQLMWDAGQDAAALLDDYYRTFYGEAAEPMRAFFEFCESHWRGQAGRTEWLKGYKSWQQFELFPAGARVEARAMLDRAAQAAREDTVRRRVAFVSEGFRVTELYGRIVDVVADLAGSGAPYDVDTVLARLSEIRALREELRRGIDAGRAMDPPPVPAAMEKVFPSPPEIRLAKRVAAWMKAADAEEDRIALEAELAVLDRWVPEAGLELAMQQTDCGTECLYNGGFEQPTMQGLGGQKAVWAALAFPEKWTPMMERGMQSAFTRWGGDARNGTFSLRADEANLEWASQEMPVVPGMAYRVSVYAKGHLGSGALVSLQVYWLDERGNPLNKAPRVLDLAGAGELPEWTELAGFAEAPAEAVAAEIRIAAEGFIRGDQVLFDDASMRLLWPSTADM